jgi:syntaxin 7
MLYSKLVQQHDPKKLTVATRCSKMVMGGNHVVAPVPGVLHLARPELAPALDWPWRRWAGAGYVVYINGVVPGTVVIAPIHNHSRLFTTSERRFGYAYRTCSFTLLNLRNMSYDRASNLEAGRSTGFSDDPAFRDLQYQLKGKLQTLLSNNRKLSNDLNVLGTKKDTPRLRERVHNTMEKSREVCREVGEGVKKLMSWEDLSVRYFELTQAPRLANSGNANNSGRNNRNTNRQRSRVTFRLRCKSSRACSEKPSRRSVRR